MAWVPATNGIQPLSYQTLDCLSAPHSCNQREKTFYEILYKVTAVFWSSTDDLLWPHISHQQIYIKVCYPLFPKPTASPVPSIRASKLPPDLTPSITCLLFTGCFASAMQTCVTPYSPSHSPKKKKEKTPQVWFHCHFRDQLFFSFHSILSLWKNLFNTSIFSAALCSLIPYLLAFTITKILQLLSQKSPMTCFVHCLYFWTL